MVLHKPEELSKCLFPVMVTAPVICTQPSLWLSGAATTVTLKPSLFLDGRQSSTLSEGRRARQKGMPEEHGRLELRRTVSDTHSPAVGNFKRHAFWNSADAWRMIKEGAGSGEREGVDKVVMSGKRSSLTSVLVSSCCYNKWPCRKD